MIFNMASGLVTGILRDHDGVEVRDVVFGWRRKWVATCGDGECQLLSLYRADVNPESLIRCCLIYSPDEKMGR